MEARRSIVILDFGGQYAHLIGNRVRKLGAFSEILPPETKAAALKHAAGIILSGGPQSVYDAGSPQADPKILSLGIPVLGLCYGLHWMTKALGGAVKPGAVKEYGQTKIEVLEGGGELLKDCTRGCTVWMSHGDEAVQLPAGFRRTATSDACANAAFEDSTRKLFAFQFHPEVTHTEHGTDMLRRFVALCKPDAWSVHGFAGRIKAAIKRDVGDRSVFMLVSGGVDSTVAFTLLNQVLGTDRVQGLLVDTGLMRTNEVKDIASAFQKLGIKNLRIEDASVEFFGALKGVTDSEEKRKRIGQTFLAVQRRVSKEMNLHVEDGWMLGQGTIYPDTIETGGTKHADQIKTHHNRVAEIEELIQKGLVIEPLKDLYKDEVRMLGVELGLPHALVQRHPFPGPGLGVRILCAEKPEPIPELKAVVSYPHVILPIRSVGVQGDSRTYRHALALFADLAEVDRPAIFDAATQIPNRDRNINRVLLCLSHASPIPFVVTKAAVTKERAELLRAADKIVHDAMTAARLYEKIWQFPVVLLPLGTRSGTESIVLRPVDSQEAMTANATHLPGQFLRDVTKKLLALPGITCVFYDLTSKPPGTIEWE